MLSREASHVGARQVNNHLWYSLRSCSFFSSCDSNFLESILEELQVEVYHEGDVIITEGDIGDTMYFLNHGEVEVSVGNSIVSRLGSGSFFGEMTLLGLSRVRGATIRALEFCDCRTLHYRNFKKTLANYPEEKARFKVLAESRREQVLRGGDSNRRHRQKSFHSKSMQRKLQLSPRSVSAHTTPRAKVQTELDTSQWKTMLNSLFEEVWSTPRNRARTPKSPTTTPKRPATAEVGTPASNKAAERTTPASTPLQQTVKQPVESRLVPSNIAKHDVSASEQVSARAGDRDSSLSSSRSSSPARGPLQPYRPMPPPIMSPRSELSSPKLLMDRALSTNSERSGPFRSRASSVASSKHSQPRKERPSELQQRNERKARDVLEDGREVILWSIARRKAEETKGGPGWKPPDASATLMDDLLHEGEEKQMRASDSGDSLPNIQDVEALLTASLQLSSGAPQQEDPPGAEEMPSQQRAYVFAEPPTSHQTSEARSKVPFAAMAAPRKAKDFWEVLSAQPRSPTPQQPFVPPHQQAVFGCGGTTPDVDESRPCRTPDLRVPLVFRRVPTAGRSRSSCQSRQESRPSSRASSSWMKVRMFGLQSHPPAMPPPVLRPLPAVPSPSPSPSLDMEEPSLCSWPPHQPPGHPPHRRHPTAARYVSEGKKSNSLVPRSNSQRAKEWEFHSPWIIDNPPPPPNTELWPVDGFVDS
mmetsp:Transcript_66690/g.159441  ORF Transcript_66690/g.159441 Transcript_66690/m.159441 type:complete len:702 (+) Transcript_66690:139-2244(+)